MDDQELGYLKAVVEQNSKAVERLEAAFLEYAKKEEENNKEISNQIQKLCDEVNMYKIIIRVMKVLGGIAILILTLKLGDIANLWENTK